MWSTCMNYASYELWTMNYAKRTSQYELRNENYEVWSDHYEKKIIIYADCFYLSPYKIKVEGD